ncbi:MAG: hypothetical protein E3K37_17545 [Candidatus Kuenenia sp.]|nr:hypothetical protein [Candidatus Kuenenia hertensis]
MEGSLSTEPANVYQSPARSDASDKNSALLIEPEHYNEIMDALRTFEDYRVGKEKLVSVRRFESLDRCQIREVIDNNRGNRDIINSFTNSMLQKMREQLCKAEVVLPRN